MKFEEIDFFGTRRRWVIYKYFYIKSNRMGGRPSSLLMIGILEMATKERLRHPSKVLVHVCWKFRQAESWNTIESKYSGLFFLSLKSSSPYGYRFFGGEVNDGIAGVLKEMSGHKIEYIAVIVLLIQYLGWENLYTFWSTHFPCCFTIKKTLLEL